MIAMKQLYKQTEQMTEIKNLSHVDKVSKDSDSYHKFPQTIIIRNQPDGQIWQVYHVYNHYDKAAIILNAYENRFEGITLEHYQPELEETSKGWNNKTFNELNIVRK